jgi:hypothetical protein
MSQFERQLTQGKVGESEIAEWLKRRGHHILPVYEIEKNQYKGPAVYTSCGGTAIAPDMLCFGNGQTTWIEAKHKDAFTWHRMTERFCTGIDLHHYSEYQKVASLIDWPVWLLFLHRGGVAKDSPPSPSGLYGNDLKKLMRCENHRHNNWGKTGMVYWEIGALKKLADYPL